MSVLYHTQNSFIVTARERFLRGVAARLSHPRPRIGLSLSLLPLVSLLSSAFAIASGPWGHGHGDVGGLVEELLVGV